MSAFISHPLGRSILVTLLVAPSGCVLPDVDLDRRPCPCVSGWVCDTAENVCVRATSMDGSVGDGDTSTMDSTVDSSRPDAGDVGPDTTDSRVDACTVAPVTEEWGDHPGSDHPGTILDTWINLNPDRLADDTDLRLYTWPTAQVANAIIIKWDLSAIPVGATIVEASMRLHQFEAGGASYSASAHRIMNCDPDIAGNQVDGYRCGAGRPWTPNSCCNAGVPMGQADFASADDVQLLSVTDGEKSWDVTSMVQMWITDPSTNLGAMIDSDPAAAADDFRSFRSNEYSVAGERPRLVVSYTSCD